MSDKTPRIAFVGGQRVGGPPVGGDDVDQLLHSAGCQIVKASGLERKAGHDHRPILALATALLRVRYSRKTPEEKPPERRTDLPPLPSRAQQMDELEVELASEARGEPPVARLTRALEEIRKILHTPFGPDFLRMVWRLVDLAGEVADLVPEDVHVPGRDEETGRGYQIVRKPASLPAGSDNRA